jgi:hypothetical protein
MAQFDKNVLFPCAPKHTCICGYSQRPFQLFLLKEIERNGGGSQVKDAGVKKVEGGMHAVQTAAKVILTCASHQRELK